MTRNGPVSAHDEPAAPATRTLATIEVRVSWCKGCGLCVEYCNRDVLVMDGVLPKVVRAERCTRCLQCEAICPDFAIEVTDGGIGAATAGSDPS